MSGSGPVLVFVPRGCWTDPNALARTQADNPRSCLTRRPVFMRPNTTGSGPVYVDAQKLPLESIRGYL